MEVQLTPWAQAVIDRVVATGVATPEEVINWAVENLLPPEIDEATAEEIRRSMPAFEEAIASGTLIPGHVAVAKARAIIEEARRKERRHAG